MADKTKKEVRTETEIGEYKGSPTITIHEVDDNGTRKPYPFSFGKAKAKLIVANYEQIKTFAES